MAQQSHESTVPSTVLASFAFESHALLRVEMVDGEPWFCAADVAPCLGMTARRARQAIDEFESDQKGSISTSTPGGPQQALFVSESGLYDLMMQSRKPEAKRFRRWVTGEVLPSIRKTGAYSVVEPGTIEWHEQQLAQQIEAVAKWKASEQRAIAAEATVELQAPAVAFAAAVEVSGWERTPKQVFGLLGVNQHTGFTSWLDLTSMVRWDWIDSGRGRKKVRIATAAGKSTGRFVVREVPWRSGKGSSAQLHVTPKGAMWIAKNAPDDVLIKSATRALAVERAAAIDDGQLSLITGH